MESGRVECSPVDFVGADAAAVVWSILYCISDFEWLSGSFKQRGLYFSCTLRLSALIHEIIFKFAE